MQAQRPRFRRCPVDGARFGTRLDIPQVGGHTREVLAGLGYRGEEVEKLIAQRIVHAA